MSDKSDKKKLLTCYLMNMRKVLCSKFGAFIMIYNKVHGNGNRCEIC